MEKKALFPILFLFTIFLEMTLVSAVQIEINSNYSAGENFIAKISGNFYTPLLKSNIYIYREESYISFEPCSLETLEGDYYFYCSIPLYREPGNYSIQMKGVKYYSGVSWSEENITKEFVITNKKAFAKISPPISVPKDYYYNLTLVNFETKRIDVEYGLEGTTTKMVSLKEGETKNVTLKTFGGDKFENILFTYGNETYSSLVYSTLTEIPIENQTFPLDENSEEIIPPAEENSQNETKSFWEILFGTPAPKNNSTNNETINKIEENLSIKNESVPQEENTIQTCEELNLLICADTEECDGTLVDGLNTQCCKGNCIVKEPSSSPWTTVGWVLIGVTAIFLIWFFKMKFSRTQMTSGGFFKK